MTRFFTLALATLVLAGPAAALAEIHPAGSSAHIRPVLFHDRSPRPHVHNVQPHH